MPKLINAGYAGVTLDGKFVGDANGVFDLDDETYARVVNTPGWTEPSRRKPVAPPAEVNTPASKAPVPPTPTSGGRGRAPAPPKAAKEDVQPPAGEPEKEPAGDPQAETKEEAPEGAGEKA